MKQKLYPLLVAALAIGSLITTSCKKKQMDGVSEPKSVTKAMAVYEQQRAKFPMTKSASIHDVVKPLPGDFVPDWERAVEKQDGDVVATTVPIGTKVHYQAVYPCSSGHSEHAEHDHTGIAVVQKMAVVISPDSAVCYIVNIVPYEDCGLGEGGIEANFVYLSGLDGFSGFAAYHDFEGSVVFVDQYEDGVKVNSAKSENRVLVSAITRGVKLYNNPNFIGLPSQESTKAADVRLASDVGFFKHCFCGNDRCKHPLVVFMHCVNCRQSYENCSCYGVSESRCPYCGLPKNAEIESRKCQCPDRRTFHDYPKCITCGAMNCYMSHKNNSSSPTCLACGDASCTSMLTTNGKHVAHADIIRTIFKSVLSSDNLHKFQYGCHNVDMSYRTEQDAYRHGVTDKFYDVDVQVDYEKLKDFFVSKVRYFKKYETYVDLGMAFHPLFDSSLSIRDRVEFSFNYYSYDRPSPIINEHYLQSYMTASAFCVTNMLRLHNIILGLPRDVSSEQVGALLDAWRYSHSEEANMQ